MIEYDYRGIEVGNVYEDSVSNRYRVLALDEGKLIVRGPSMVYEVSPQAFLTSEPIVKKIRPKPVPEGWKKTYHSLEYTDIDGDQLRIDLQEDCLGVSARSASTGEVNYVDLPSIATLREALDYLEG